MPKSNINLITIFCYCTNILHYVFNEDENIQSCRIYQLMCKHIIKIIQNIWSLMITHSSHNFFIYN